jgi:branched-chain amino acid transport system substrate-binding protein
VVPVQGIEPTGARRWCGAARLAGGLVAAALVTVSCSGPDRAEGAASVAPVPDTPGNVPVASDVVPETDVIAEDMPADDGSVVSGHAGKRWFLGLIPAAGTPADESLEPIVLGMINQEDNPVGSYPELRVAVEAAAAWVNAELGGVDGRPVEIHTCVTTFNADESRACALELIERGVVAFVGGVDVLSIGSYPVIEQSGLVSVGGIPANLVEQRSPNAFFFSGGDAGALAAFMAHAADSGRTKVALAYGQEVESFEVAAREYGAAVGESLGLEVALIPFSLFTTDYSPVLTAARDAGADAVMVLAASVACVPVMQLAAELQLYLTGACAAEEVIDAAGDSAVGVIFNAEGRVDGIDIEASLYQDVVERYADEPAGGAGTVGFRGFMNLYALLLEAGGDDATSDTLARLARASVDRRSFWGHPYTCDGNQVPGLPALCAPQQLLFELATTGDGFSAVTGWIPTDELFARALG